MCYDHSKSQKNKKVNPVNTLLIPGGINPGGNANFGDTDGTLGDHHSRKMVPRGSRLTPERLGQLQIGNGFLSEAVFIDISFE